MDVWMDVCRDAWIPVEAWLKYAPHTFTPTSTPPAFPYTFTLCALCVCSCAFNILFMQAHLNTRAPNSAPRIEPSSGVCPPRGPHAEPPASTLSCSDILVGSASWPRSACLCTRRFTIACRRLRVPASDLVHFLLRRPSVSALRSLHSRAHGLRLISQLRHLRLRVSLRLLLSALRIRTART